MCCTNSQSHTSRYRPIGQVSPGLAFNWHCASTWHNLFILPKISGALLWQPVRQLTLSISCRFVLGIVAPYPSVVGMLQMHVTKFFKGRQRPGTVCWVLSDSLGPHHPLQYLVWYSNDWIGCLPLEKASERKKGLMWWIRCLPHWLNWVSQERKKIWYPMSIEGVPFDSCRVPVGHHITAHNSYAFLMFREDYWCDSLTKQNQTLS